MGWPATMPLFAVVLLMAAAMVAGDSGPRGPTAGRSTRCGPFVLGLVCGLVVE